MRKLTLIILLYLAPTLLFAHPVHLTVTNVDIDTNTGKGSVFIKIFATDLQDAISLWKGEHISIKDILLDVDRSIWIHQYISNNLSLSMSKKMSLVFDEYKTENDYLLLYYSFDFGKHTNTMEIFNALLTEYIPDQSNLLILTIDGVDKGLNFSSATKTILVELK